MAMQFKGYAFLAVALVLLSAAACSQIKEPTEGPAEKPPSDGCSAAQYYIERAQAITSNLEDFDWKEFSEIGIVCPPQGMCSVSAVPIVEEKSVTGEALTRWTSVAALLPSQETVKIYRIQCDNCLKLAGELCQLDPGNEPATEASQSDNLTVSHWQEQCSQLQSALRGAEYLISKNKTIAQDYTFPLVITYFTDSDEQIKRDYLDRFVTESSKYVELQAEMIQEIRQAQQVTDKLAGGQPSSPEGEDR
jgi:hypothetical protein